MSRRTAGSVVILALAASWGVISILVREIDLPALALVFWRVALSAVVVGVVLVVRGRAGELRAPRPASLALGVLLALHWGCYFGAIKETSVASANLVTYASPIVVAGLAPVVLGERVGGVTWAALGASMAGIAVIALLGPAHGSGAVRPAGVALGAAAAVSYAILIVLVKRHRLGADPIRSVFWQSVAASMVMAPAAAVADYAPLSAGQWGELLLLGVVLTGLSGLVYMAALHVVPATTGGILAYMEPVSAALLAVALLGEPLTAAVVAGGALIVAGGVAVIAAGTGTDEPAEVAAAGGPTSMAT